VIFNYSISASVKVKYGSKLLSIQDYASYFE